MLGQSPELAARLGPVRLPGQCNYDHRSQNPHEERFSSVLQNNSPISIRYRAMAQQEFAKIRMLLWAAAEFLFCRFQQFRKFGRFVGDRSIRAPLYSYSCRELAYENGRKKRHMSMGL
jgi:hypothetical protein